MTFVIYKLKYKKKIINFSSIKYQQFLKNIQDLLEKYVRKFRNTVFLKWCVLEKKVLFFVQNCFETKKNNELIVRSVRSDPQYVT